LRMQILETRFSADLVWAEIDGEPARILLFLYTRIRLSMEHKGTYEFLPTVASCFSFACFLFKECSVLQVFH